MFHLHQVSFAISSNIIMSEVLAATSPHTIEVPRFSTHEKDIKASPINPVDVAQTWTTKLNGVFDSEDASKLAALFHQDCWWRDQLALSWDFRTLRGLTTVIDYVKGKLPRAHLRNIKIRTKGAFAPSTRQSLEGLEWVQSMFDFETEMGSGSGVFRLVQGADGEWKAYAISTMLQQLTDHKEQTGHLRPPGGNNSLLGGSVKGNWSDRRHRQAEFLDEEPVVLVIGAG
jgi:hypothetical protein